MQNSFELLEFLLRLKEKKIKLIDSQLIISNPTLSDPKGTNPKKDNKKDNTGIEPVTT